MSPTGHRVSEAQLAGSNGSRVRGSSSPMSPLFSLLKYPVRTAVALLNRTRKGAEEVQATESAPGPESVSVDGT